MRSYDHERRVEVESARRKIGSNRTYTSQSSSQNKKERLYQEDETRLNYGKADEFQIWEVARAATAAPFYLDPLKTTKPGTSDRVLFRKYEHANPIMEIVKEFEMLYGKDKFGVGVNVDTATFPEGKIRPFHATTENSFSYYRFNDPNASNVEWDDWEPEKSIFTKSSGHLTTAKIEKAFDEWAARPEAVDELQKCAIALVRYRRVRAMDTDRWERFSIGARFHCPVVGCSDGDFLSRRSFRMHLQREHPERPNIHGQEEEHCRSIWTPQKYKTAQPAASAPSSAQDPQVRLQESPLSQPRITPPQDDIIDNPTAPFSRTSTNNSHSGNDPDSTAADEFAKDPQLFYDTMHDLQNRIFEFGGDCIGDISWKDTGHCLALPIVPSGPSGSSPELLPSLKLLLERNLKLLQAVLEGLHHLNAVEFCKPVYNVIVQDANRDDVLRVVPIDSSTLFSLYALIKEALFNCTLSRWESFQDVMSNIERAVRLILDHLNLSTSSGFDLHSLGHQQPLSVCQSLSSTASVLFIGLVSFVRSHLVVFDETSMHPSHLRIEAVGESLFMRPKRLACLDACLQHPVWVFEKRSSKEPDSSYNERPNRFAVSIFLADLADLWGPIKLTYSENETSSLAEIKIRGGTIRKSEPRDSSSRLPNETECHWHDWLDTSARLEGNGNLSTTGRLLIGTTGNTMQRPKKSPLGSSACNRRSYAQMFQEFELGTKLPSWNLDTKNGQLSAGKYVNITYGQTWKFDAGWTLKQVIIEDWLENVSESERHRPKPFYLDYMVVIETSRCSGHSRRLSLWQLIARNAVDGYVSGLLEDETSREEFRVLKSYGFDTSFADIWHEKLSNRYRTLVVSIVRGLLLNMRHTGVAEDGSLQTWDITSRNRIDGRRIDPNWTTMVKDDTISACFAVMTHNCFRFDGVPHADPRYHQDSVLFTKICVTVDKSARREARGTKDMNRWRVVQPETQNAIDYHRMRVIEEARLMSRPDFSSIEIAHSSTKAEFGFGENLGNTRINTAEIQRQRELKVSTRSSREITPQHNNFRRDQETSPAQRGSKEMFCDRCMEFKNGKGNRIGNLTLRFHGPTMRINLSRLSENQPLPVGWDSRKDSRITKLSKKAKGKVSEVDGVAIKWVKRHFSTPLPWMIRPDAEDQAFREYAVEHLRGGDVEDCQKILTVHVY